MAEPTSELKNYSTVNRAASRQIFIASPSANRLTLWHLCQFVEAAVAAGLPNDTIIEGSLSPERGLSGVSARFIEAIHGWPEEPTHVDA